MKATGIVRRIDDLGRVVIPKEIRRTLRIREGDPLEIFVDREGEVILKKYAPIGELGDFAKEFADSLNETVGHIALVADRDAVIAVAGAPKKEFMDKRVGPAVERAFNEHTLVLIPRTADMKGAGGLMFDDDDNGRFSSYAVAPIMAHGDTIGAVILCSKDPGTRMGEVEGKLANTAATFLGRQMEH